MAGRYYERTQGIERARREVEGILAGILLDAFTALWSLIFPKVRDGRTDQIDKTVDEWGDEFDDDYSGGLELGAGILAKSEVDWWAANDKGIEISGAEVARQFEADNVSAFGNKPADMIAANIKAGLQNEITAATARGWTTDELNARLRRWMDEARAKTISVTDTNNLMSTVTKIGMERAGVGFWVWQTMEDDRVCEECEPLHGRVYSINDEMPPKHHNCRCIVVPLKQWLRQHDQPFYSIAEGLAER